MALPFLKWPGGKRWAAPIIAPIAADWLRKTYIEPFLGSGSVYFLLRPPAALLSDINRELIFTYRAVQRNPRTIIEKLKTMPVTEEAYYQIRSSNPSGSLNQAARTLYLNRTAFGGVYRLNRRGQFNVPYGGGQRTPNILWERDILHRASAGLAGAVIEPCDFEPAMECAGAGDVVYCDPTYTVTHDTNCFVRYNERNFAWADQKRLADTAMRAAKRGALVLVSNAHHQDVLELYPNAEVRVLSRMSCISRTPDKRRLVQEYLFILSPTRRGRG